MPRHPSLSQDKAFVNKYAPYLKPATAAVPRATRPTILGAKYNEGSKDIYQGISKILNGSPASSVLPGDPVPAPGIGQVGKHACSSGGGWRLLILPRSDR